MPQLDINGTRINYTDRGRGRALVLLHGFPLDGRVWDGVADLLSRTIRVIVPDLRGFGINAPADAFTMQDLANDVADLVNQLVIAPCAVAGLSMGGYVAQTLAKYNPDVVSQLILVDTKAEADTEQARAKRDAMAATALAEGAKGVTAQMLPNMLAPEAPATIVAGLKGIMESQHAPTLAAASIAMRDRDDFTEFLKETRLPLGLIFGKADAISPIAIGQAIAAGNAGAKLVEIENAGHMAPFEQPQAVADAILKLLA
ncbi:MAG: alpha/beta fold hydrolase [Tepidisphaeraceae bacterium]